MPPAGGSFSFAHHDRDPPPTPGFSLPSKGPAQDLSSLPNGHLTSDTPAARTASFPPARPVTQDAPSSSTDPNDLLDGSMVPAEALNRPNFWAEPFQPAKPSQAPSLRQPHAGQEPSLANGSPAGKSSFNAGRAAPPQTPIAHAAKYGPFHGLPSQVASQIYQALIVT